MPTSQTGKKSEEFKYKNGTITIMETPATRFGVLYFPKFSLKENDKSLGNYYETAFSTIEKAKQHGIEIADQYINSISKKKEISLER